MNQVHDRRTILGVADRGDITLGLVEKQVDVPPLSRSLQKLSVDANVVRLGIGLAPQLGDYSPVYLHVAGGDQLLRLSPGSNAGCGDDFLQACGGHERSPQSGQEAIRLFRFPLHSPRWIRLVA